MGFENSYRSFKGQKHILPFLEIGDYFIDVKQKEDNIWLYTIRYVYCINKKTGEIKYFKKDKDIGRIKLSDLKDYDLLISYPQKNKIKLYKLDK